MEVLVLMNIIRISILCNIKEKYLNTIDYKFTAIIQYLKDKLNLEPKFN